MRYFGALPFLAALLAGCNSIPQPSHDGVEVQAIVNAIQCEIKEALDSPYGEATFRNKLARTRLELKVIYEWQNTTSLTINPLISGPAISVPVGTDIHDQSTRLAVLEFDTYINDLNSRHYTSAKYRTPVCGAYPSGMPPIGGLGVGAWMATVAGATGEPNDPVALHEVTYKLEFLLIRAANGGLTVKDARVSLDLAKQTFSKSLENVLYVTFAPDERKQGKKKTAASGDTSKRLDTQIDRVRPLRLKLDGSGRIQLTQ
jgi:hypothetical protein